MLSQTEIELFFKLMYALVWNINEKHKIVPAFKKPIYGDRVNDEPFLAIRAQLWENPHWIDELLCADDCGELTEVERGILADWRNHFIKGKFFIVKHLAKYSVFMSYESEQFYGVHGISDSIQEMGIGLTPFYLEAVLLPYKGKIIVDGLFYSSSISLEKGLRDGLKAPYKEQKEKVGIIEVLGEPPVREGLPVCWESSAEQLTFVDQHVPAEQPLHVDHAVPAKSTAKKPKTAIPNIPKASPKVTNIPKAMVGRYQEVAEIIEGFCDEKLNAEYEELCLHALQKLCRKRPSPLLGGKARTWACGIVYAIASNNFIFDKSQPIHMTADDIAGWFGLAKSTAGNKAAEVIRLLNISYFNAEFSLKSHIDSNPAIWYLSVNGYYVDIRDMPREVQMEALRKGLIPYLPEERE